MLLNNNLHWQNTQLQKSTRLSYQVAARWYLINVCCWSASGFGRHPGFRMVLYSVTPTLNDTVYMYKNICDVDTRNNDTDRRLNICSPTSFGIWCGDEWNTVGATDGWTEPTWIQLDRQVMQSKHINKCSLGILCAQSRCPIHVWLRIIVSIYSGSVDVLFVYGCARIWTQVAWRRAVTAPIVFHIISETYILVNKCVDHVRYDDDCLYYISVPVKSRDSLAAPQPRRLTHSREKETSCKYTMVAPRSVRVRT